MAVRMGNSLNLVIYEKLNSTLCQGIHYIPRRKSRIYWFHVHRATSVGFVLCVQ